MADEPRDPDSAQQLLSRLRVIDSQPLAARAEAYAALHDELAHRLEADPVPPSA